MLIQAAPSTFPRADAYRNPRTPPFRDDAGRYHVFSYEHVMKVLTNRERAFTRDPSLWLPDGVQNIALDFMWTVEPFTVDGELGRHHALRSVVEPWFRSRALEAMEPSVRAITRGLIGEVIRSGRGELNFAREIAYRTAIRVICSLVGIELDRESWLRDKLDEFNQTARYEDLPRQWDLEAYFWELIAKRVAQPRDELLDVLIAAWKDARISDRELLGYMAGMVNAGTDTTGTSLVNAFALLAEFGQLQSVHDHLQDTETVDRVVEEVLRFGTPFPMKQLHVLKEVDFDGFVVPRGGTLCIWYAAANRDQQVNGGVAQADPETFDVSRWPNRHLALGYGKHFCLGGDLARLEMRILIDEGLRLLPGLELDRRRPFTRYAGIVDVVTEAYFTFDQRAASAAWAKSGGEHDG